MNMATASSNANLALLKYWGLDENGLAFMPSVSIPLVNLETKTSVELVDDLDVCVVEFNGYGSERIKDFTNRFLNEFGIKKGYIVRTENSFLSGVGMASSASGFSALAKCLSVLCGVDVLDDRVLNLLRVESGSALRSLLPGVVWWDPSANQLLRRDDLEKFDVVDVVVKVSDDHKEISSKVLHKLVPDSVLFTDRVASFEQRWRKLERSMLEDNWGDFADVIEEEAFSMLLQSWSCNCKAELINQDSLRLWEQVKSWQTEGLPACVTFDAGPTAHILTRSETVDLIKLRLKKLGMVTY